MSKTIKVDTTQIGSFSTVELARWSLNRRFYTLAQLNGVNYNVLVDVGGELYYLEYLFKESGEALRIEVEIEEEPIKEPKHKSDE